MLYLMSKKVASVQPIVNAVCGPCDGTCQGSLTIATIEMELD